MEVSIRRFDTALPLPEYKTAGASALDLYVREEKTIPPKAVKVLHMNVAIKPPPGHFALMAARSSLWKRGLMLANNIGILDEDYSGSNDEYLAPIYNFSDEPVIVEKGDRLVQIILLPYDKVTWKEESLSDPDRGAFGTTGK